jgi:hypothetical protein
VSESGLTAEVERFIAEHIHSVEQIEVLLLVQRTAPREWTAPQIAAELRTGIPSAASRLADLTARRMLGTLERAEPTYVYAPTPELDRSVRALRLAYAERRVAVINAIFAKPAATVEAMRAFAAAFRLRNGGE